ncbi:hypothetical protein [Paenibacillus sp. MBLB4367]
MRKSISFGIVLHGLMFGLLMIQWDNKAHAEILTVGILEEYNAI